VGKAGCGKSRVLVTGSAGHLGEALMRALEHSSHEALGLDIKNSPFTQQVGSITQQSFVKRCMQGVDAVVHTATLHKPHIATHSRQDFVDTNVTGTLILLEEATSAGVGSFVFTSTTSVFGRALTPPAGAPAAWITEEVTPVPKNIYGVTELAAENLCDLFHYRSGLPCIVLRTSRFFPEEDDDKKVRQNYQRRQRQGQ
jgi:UDP-glucose 4-epimerase